MEQIRRKDLERAQLAMLSAVVDKHFTYGPGPWNATLDAAELEAFCIVRSANLDIDSPSPCDFEPRFFSPCCDEIDGLEEEIKDWRRHWRATMVNPRSRLDPEWIPMAGCIHAEMRAEWFNHVLSRLQSRVEGEIHPVYVIFLALGSPDSRLTPHSSNVYTENLDEGCHWPYGAAGRESYEFGGCAVPVAADKPHSAIAVFDHAVAAEGEVRWSEFHAIIAALESRLRMGQFTDHHTKPA